MAKSNARIKVPYIIVIISLTFVAISCYGIYVADDPYKSQICTILQNNNGSYTVNMTNVVITAYGHSGFQQGDKYMCVIIDEIVVLTEKKSPMVLVQIVLGITAFVYLTIFTVNFISISLNVYKNCVYKKEVMYLNENVV